MEKIRFKHIFLFALTMLVLVRCVNIAFENTKQEELAQRLGVDINRYPKNAPFPVNYFLAVLKPGMTKSGVHAIVTGYEQALHCERYAEIYYYYSKDDGKALRFEIFYYEDGKYSKLVGEGDRDKLFDEGCVPGLLDENIK